MTSTVDQIKTFRLFTRHAPHHLRLLLLRSCMNCDPVLIAHTRWSRINLASCALASTPIANTQPQWSKCDPQIHDQMLCFRSCPATSPPSRCVHASTAVHLPLHTHVGLDLISRCVHFCMHQSHTHDHSGANAIANLVAKCSIFAICHPPPTHAPTSVHAVRRAVSTDLPDQYLFAQIAQVTSNATLRTYVIPLRDVATCNVVIHIALLRFDTMFSLQIRMGTLRNQRSARGSPTASAAKARAKKKSTTRGKHSDCHSLTSCS